MKKNIYKVLLIIVITIILFINNNLISDISLNITRLFVGNVLPNLLLMFIVSRLLINYNFPYYVSKLFNNNIYVYIFILSFLSGSPNNVIIIKDLYNKNIINADEANKYIKCSYFTNPLFLYTSLIGILRPRLIYLIIVSQIISNIIIYAYKPINKHNNSIYLSQRTFLDVFINSIKDSALTFLNIYFIILVFNLLIIVIPNKLSFLYGLIELTNGLNNIRYLNILEYNKSLLTIIYVCFGGLSIHMQIKSILDNTNILYINFLKSRFFHIIITIIIYSLLAIFC